MSDDKFAYMCKTDFDFELGEALGGTRVYLSIKDLLYNRKCTNQCGYVKVRIILEDIIKEDAWTKQREEAFETE